MSHPGIVSEAVGRRELEYMKPGSLVMVGIAVLTEGNVAGGTVIVGPTLTV